MTTEPTWNSFESNPPSEQPARWLDVILNDGDKTVMQMSTEHVQTWKPFLWREPNDH